MEPSLKHVRNQGGLAPF